ncbi:MAG TPA: amidohydrolase family protein, partial [Microlunatus sp.]|nr:amidohydrolase family protein [Microlunatus sp.]
AHLVQTGLMAAGLDLHDVRRREDVLDRLAAYVRTHPGAGPVIGQGWDERDWPDPRPPTRAELDRAGRDRPVYLARVDVHSAVASSALLAAVPGVETLAGSGSGDLLSRDAHHAVRTAVGALTTDEQRRTAASTALMQAAEQGLGTVHELGGPHLGPIEDLLRVRQEAERLGVRTVSYWGELASAEAFDRAAAVGALGLAGDLCIDGAIGSRTAALREPYRDDPGLGARYLDDEEIAGHLIACTRAGLQAGFHCIGDDAVAAAVDGLRRAAEVLGRDAMIAARHRLEHVEMLAHGDAATLATYGVVASMQPAFDAIWGGPGELYEQRLGVERADSMNPLGTLAAARVVLAFGSDAPVTPLAGWETVRAAVTHHRPDQRLSVGDAFAAATRGGHTAARSSAGRLAAGEPADLAIWDRVPESSGPDGLPRLSDNAPLPAWRATMVDGRLVAGRWG